jgi:diketogulonate reductase-like aldo/keto reductase
LLDYCAEKKIVIEAYSPSAPVTKFAGGPVDAAVDEVAKDLSSKSGKQVNRGQVLLKVRCRSRSKKSSLIEE